MKPFPDAQSLGFAGSESEGWTRDLRGREVRFRLLATLAELAQVERLQLEVFGVSERDLVPASELIVVPETGGAVIGAFLTAESERAAGVLVGWGGFVGKPRIVSDFMAVQPEARNLGLAEQMKRLQAAIALERGFEEIVWTVDPLRAANARLNFGKLGAVARHYEIDRYGATFASELYGGMPTDRLHLVWEITTPRVRDRLLHAAPPEAPAALPPEYALNFDVAEARIPIPADIDLLQAEDPKAALEWRLRLREMLTSAFAAGFTVTGFFPASAGRLPALVLRRDEGGEPAPAPPPQPVRR